MKLRPMTWGRGLELVFGVVIPGWYILPFLLTSSFFAITLPFTSPGVSVGFRDSAPVLAITAITLMALCSLAWLILAGPERVNRLKPFRIFGVAIGSIGLLVGALFFLSGLGGWIGLFAHKEFWGLFSKKPVFDLHTWRFILFEDARFISLALVGPLVVGFKYLRVLFKSGNV